MKISIIVPTYNSRKYLKRCLDSIKHQTYKNIELIVVDNNSTDKTKEIAKEYTKEVYNIGPERCAQINFGSKQATGEIVYRVDSDFVLEKEVIEQCVNEIKKGFDAIVVHNTPDETISWIAKIRKFEVDMYKNDLTYSSARFVKKEVYEAVNGLSESMTAGEDFDFQNKLNRDGYKTGFVDAEALHLGEPTNIFKHLQKYYYYGKDFVNYKQENVTESKTQLSFIRPVYLRNWKKFLKHPLMSIAFILYSTAKFSAGGLGYFLVKTKIFKKENFNYK